MLLAKLIWFHIVLILSICLFNTNAVYPVPGSYYSVLLRYNNRGKNRKGARIGPSPLRLWAYFDPPSVLGSLELGSIDNNLEVHNRKRSVWASQGTVTGSKEEEVPPARDVETIREEIQSAKISPFSSDSERAKIQKATWRPLNSEQKGNRKLDDTEGATNGVTSSCGGNEEVILDPSNYVPDGEGRFFYKIIQTIGYPNFYESPTKCIWNFQIGRECQMGMIIVEFLEGKLLDSSQCQLDSISILFNGESKKKVCGSMSGVISTLKWTKTGKQLVQLALESKSEEEIFAAGHEWGGKISLSGYCWVYSPHFLTQSLAAIKKKESSKREPVKVSEADDENTQNTETKGERDILSKGKENITTSETLKPIMDSNLKITMENSLLTTVSAKDTETQTETEFYETTTTDEILELKSEYTTMEALLKSDDKLMTTLVPSVPIPEN